jgi:hypothetical protein
MTTLSPGVARGWFVKPRRGKDVAIRFLNQDYTEERLANPAAHSANTNDGPARMCRPVVAFFVDTFDLVNVTAG